MLGCQERSGLIILGKDGGYFDARIARDRQTTALEANSYFKHKAHTLFPPPSRVAFA